jgi:hypothetical protein
MNMSAGTHLGLTFLLLGVGGVYRPGGVATFFGVARPPLRVPFATARG